jgi:hypothetical protein
MSSKLDFILFAITREMVQLVEYLITIVIHKKLTTTKKFQVKRLVIPDLK